VKVFRPGTGVETEEGFGSEAVILARLQHPGLVTAYDAGRHDGRAYLVMQLIEGSTLKARIAEGPLSCEDTVALGAGLARALAHAHEAGIVHRDVKPSNILLDASDRPYLTDFGISRLVDATTRTATGTLIGTAAYLSPEQVLGQSVGRPADIYALGLVLLECLTGRLEYGGGPLEAAIARLHRQPVLPSSLPNELAALLRDMTALDEQTRPSALDCARKLAALADTPLSTPIALSAHVTALVGSPDRAHDDDPTHLAPLPAPDRAAPKTSPVRSRALVAGGTVALATVMAATFAVFSDGFPPPGNDEKSTRAVSRTAEETGPDGSSAGRNDASATPVTPPASTPGASAGLLRDATPGRSVPPDGSNREPVSSTAASRYPTSDSTVQAETKRAAPSKQAGKPKKAGKAEDTAQQKSEGKKASKTS
jgi:serine/threonine protein kinase